MSHPDEQLEACGQTRTCFAHIDDEHALCKLSAYVDRAKAAAGPWYITGRPLEDVIRDMRNHIAMLEGQTNA